MAYWRSRPRTKFGNKITQLDGNRFASLKEARRYTELKLLMQAGEVRELTLQPRYPLVVNGVKVAVYVGDFYVVWADGTAVLEDVKSPATKTAVYRLKKQLMKACYGLEIREV
jgi:hypothetical protein